MVSRLFQNRKMARHIGGVLLSALLLVSAVNPMYVHAADKTYSFSGMAQSHKSWNGSDYGNITGNVVILRFKEGDILTGINVRISDRTHHEDGCSGSLVIYDKNGKALWSYYNAMSSYPTGHYDDKAAENFQIYRVRNISQKFHIENAAYMRIDPYFSGGMFCSGTVTYTDNREITYNSNNGSGTMDKTVVPANQINNPVDLKENVFYRTGYDWANWNTSADGSGTAYEDKATLPNLLNSVTVYAQWKPHTYKVNFDANSTKDNDITGSMSAITFTYDITKLPECKYNRIGYTFKCWNTSPDGSGTGKKPNAEGWRASSYTSVTDMLPGDIVNLTPEDGAEVTLYAIWEPITYTVKFHANNGPDVDHGTVGESGVISKTFTYDVSYPVESYGFTNGDIPFSGWNTKSDMTGSHYETELINLASHQGDIVELYAVWDIYNLYYNGHRPTKVIMDGGRIKGLYKDGTSRDNLYFGH